MAAPTSSPGRRRQRRQRGGVVEAAGVLRPVMYEGGPARPAHRALDAIFEIGRGNLRATDDLAFKSLDYAAAAGHAAVAVQHVIAARKDLWP